MNIDVGLDEFLKGFLTEARKLRMEEVLSRRTRYITVVLEDLFQPHNASAVLRSCDGFGIQDVHVISRKNEWRPNPEIALGSAQWLDIHLSRSDSSDVIGALKQRGYRIVATTPHERSCTVYDLDLRKGPVALIFGTELNGISDSVTSVADEFVTIPMCGFVESFNISVSVAICLSELTRRMHTDGIAWQIHDDEKKEIMHRWLRSSLKQAEALEREYYSRQTSTATLAPVSADPARL